MSILYAAFQLKYERSTSCYLVWRDVFLGKINGFVTKPLLVSFVDEKISGLDYMMAAFLLIVKK